MTQIICQKKGQADYKLNFNGKPVGKITLKAKWSPEKRVLSRSVEKSLGTR